MGDLLLPVGNRRANSWAQHQGRRPRSTEPGTDWYCPIGTPVRAPYDGKIYGYGTSIVPATGLWVGIDLDNGMRFRGLHFSSIVRATGRVQRGEVIAYSGATGYGEWDWSSNPDTGGAHVHGTLWPTHQSIYGYRPNGQPYTIDFMAHADTGGSAAGGGSTPFTPEQDKDTDMRFFLMTVEAVQGAGFSKGIRRYLIDLESFTKREISSEAEVLIKTAGVPAIAGLQPKSYGDQFAG